MMTWLLILVLLLLFFIPDSLWFKFDLLMKKFFAQLRLNQLQKAKKFSRHLDQVILHSRLGKEIERVDCIDFYPYINTLQKLLKMKALYGCNIFSQLQLLKNDIHEEIIFIDLKNKTSKAAYFQFFSMMLIIFSFQFFSSNLLDIHFDLKTALYCFILEVLGFLLFHLISKRKIKTLFKDVNQLQGFFCEAESLLYGQLPANRVIQELAEVSPMLKGDKEQEIQGQLFYFLKNWQQSGQPIKEDFKLLKAELLHHRREIMNRVKKFLDFLVFVILVLFFLSSYFLSLSPLFQVIFVA